MRWSWSSASDEHAPAKAARCSLGHRRRLRDLSARAGEDLLFTTDQMIEGVHFYARAAGRMRLASRALARSLSDIAAMGGEPRFCLVSLALAPGG